MSTSISRSRGSASCGTEIRGGLIRAEGTRAGFAGQRAEFTGHGQFKLSDVDVSEYCRQIETYLCQKNDGHLIRVVGPSFEMVSDGPATGVPLKIAFGGIDRYFERYYRKGPRRRPVRIDFCEADVLDVFDEWRRATGVTAAAVSGDDASTAPRRGPSLPEHLERVLIRLTNARAKDLVGARSRPADRAVVRRARSCADFAGGVRGEVRKALLDRLVEADALLMTTARLGLDAGQLEDIRRDVDSELDGFGEHMPPEALARARERAIDRLLRERLHLPTIAFS